MFKASEKCPRIHRLIVDVLLEAGLPAGTVNFVSHAAHDAPAVVEAMIAHPAVRRVNFTGSTSVGRVIGRLCGEHLTPCVLELGGKAPLVVLDDADVEQAVNAAAFGAFANSGQICMSTERIIVDEAVADEFVTALAIKANGLPHGDPSGQVVLGSVIDESTVQRCARRSARNTSSPCGAPVTSSAGVEPACCRCQRRRKPPEGRRYRP